MELVYTPANYIATPGISYSGLLNEGKLKHKDHMAPFYEAFTNALESIKLHVKYHKSNLKEHSININLFHTSSGVLLSEDKLFEKISFVDSGIGFNDENFHRLLTYKDNSKGFYNKGSGRIQFLMFFKKTEFKSIFIKDNITYYRSFILSKDYLTNGSFIFYNSLDISQGTDIVTNITFSGPIVEGDKIFYDRLDAEELKKKLIAKYLLEFCLNRANLPQINIHQYVDNILINTFNIDTHELPEFNKQSKVSVNYSRIGVTGEVEIITDRTAEFSILAFVIPKDQLDKNEIKFTTKGELVDTDFINIKYLDTKDDIGGNRYLFLVSSEYLNNKDDDIRGNLHLTTTLDLKSNDGLSLTEDILIEHISDKINHEIEQLYPEILAIKANKNVELDRLREMFLLNKNTVDGLKINITDSDEVILRKVYKTDSELLAKKDAELKKYLDSLKQLDPRDKNYLEVLKNITKKVVLNIPLQNRTALTYYVARRKLVLELFNNVLEKELLLEKEIDEKLLHNLIFQQSTSNPHNSDLWLINEDFIYFNGISESKLGDVQFNGETLFKINLTDDELKYRHELDQDTNLKRPDILLFPDEGKCIIIEFKNPDVNVSKHLTQINNYASIILNLANDKFKITTFYGYLIGEKISSIDVRRHNGNYEEAYNFDYLFLPNTKIAGEFGHHDGYLYTEVISYSTLLKRAIKRNEVFINKLMEPQTI